MESTVFRFSAVDRTKDEISPEFDENLYRKDDYRSRLGSYYYGETGAHTSSF